ncbi:MAG: anthranilate synthase component I family protein [Cyclobacteriaceae bacterium]|nr:anthranilate synthase component I family protein [Cyclobacteriaceae bacterium]
MKKIKTTTRYKKLLADTITPVSLYLRLRDVYANSILLESSDYHGNDNSYSFICCNPIASFEVKNRQVKTSFPNSAPDYQQLSGKGDFEKKLQEFMDSFVASEPVPEFIPNGIFGYINYDAVSYFDNFSWDYDESEIPEIRYAYYEFILIINHFKNELYVVQNTYDGGKGDIDTFINFIRSAKNPVYTFDTTSEENSTMKDEDFLSIVEKCIAHCNRGDVFQIVPSRRFDISFKGDEFNVYRALRSINPSPYLFYFDYGSYKIFGSSPEAQLVIRNHTASIYPIAGTFRRTGDDEKDRIEAERLRNDDKENSEHVMLVDLARNDLSKSISQVKVDTFKEIQFYSHVIHLVSKVSGKIDEKDNSLSLITETFPAGTLSGAPKHMALELLHKYEPTRRGYYGGAIGFLGFNGDFNHAIMIRSFFSRENTLYFQAGAGVVAKSKPENELNEVSNKLMALRSAIEEAKNINRM